VFAIFKKEKDFDLKDLSVLYEENDIQVNFLNDGTAFVQMKSDFQNDQPNLIEISNSNKQNSISQNNGIQKQVLPKETEIRTNTAPSIKQANQTSKETKPPQNQKKSQDKLNFASQPNNTQKPIKTESNYEEVNSNNSSKDKIITNFENNFKINEDDVIVEDPDENFYGGKIVSKFASTKNEIPTLNTTKRKASPGLEEVPDKRKKEEKSQKLESANISDSEHSTKNSNNNNRKKVKKIRKIPHTRYAEDESGYLHAIDEYIDEEYWSDEITPPPKKQFPLTQPDDKKTKGKQTNSGQGNLLNFFSKNK
jgi:hypothetical protein